MIKKIRLVGCQSWEDSTIELATDRLNIIKALNNVGKSVLIKMLKISANPKMFSARKRKKLIRWGHQYAEALYEFVDGCIGGVIVYPTKVLYLYRTPEDDVWTKSYEPDSRMIENLGLIVNDDGDFIANIVDTEQNLLLVDSEAKATYEFVNMLCNNARLNEYLEKLNDANHNMYYSGLKLESDLNTVRQELSKAKYIDIDELQQNVDLLMCAKNVLYSNISISYALNSLLDGLEYARDYEKLGLVLSTLEALESIHLSECSERSFNQDLLQVCDILQKFEKLELNQIYVKGKMIDDSVLKILEKLESINLFDCLERKEPPENRIVECLEQIENANAALDQFYASNQTAKELRDSIDNLEKMFRESGDTYECPIYGGVVFDGKECIPFDS